MAEPHQHQRALVSAGVGGDPLAQCGNVRSGCGLRLPPLLQLVQFVQGVHVPSPINLRRLARARFRRTPTLVSDMPSTAAISA